MKTLIFIITAMLALIACDDEQQDADVIDASIEISVKSGDGTDLLDPENPDSFDENQIRIYHLIDEVFKEVNLPNSDYPNGFFIYEHSNSVYRISIGGEVFQNNNMMTSLVEWNDSDIDTLKYEIKRYANGATVVISKVWFNDVEVWDESSKTERYFEIIK